MHTSMRVYVLFLEFEIDGINTGRVYLEVNGNREENKQDFKRIILK